MRNGFGGIEKIMNVLIVGCGRVGLRLIETLEGLGHDVAVVDDNPRRLEKLSEMSPPFSGMAVRGVHIDVDVLRSAGIEDCDAVAAVTQDDNINVMVAQMAKEVFHVHNVIARVTDPGAKEVFSERFSLHAVCGTNLTAQAIVAGMMQEAADETMSVMFGSSTASFTTVPVSAQQVHQPLSQVEAPRPGMMVFGVWRASGVLELAVQPGLVLHAGDRIVFANPAD